MSKNKYLQQIVQRVTQSLHPVAIVLFGSHAYGIPNDDSDWDILVVTKTEKSYRERIRQMDELFLDRTQPMDFVVRTPKEIKERIQKGDFFLEEIMNKGKVLYGRRTI